MPHADQYTGCSFSEPQAAKDASLKRPYGGRGVGVRAVVEGQGDPTGVVDPLEAREALPARQRLDVLREARDGRLPGSLLACAQQAVAQLALLLRRGIETRRIGEGFEPA